MTYEFMLPSKESDSISYKTDTNSIIIIGANGSGKSRIGYWLEKVNPEKVHRIVAQRSLCFEKYITQKSYKQSYNLLTYGSENEDITHDRKYKWVKSEHNFTMASDNDFDTVLSLLLAKKNIQQDRYISECRERDAQGKQHGCVPDNVVDQLRRIWKDVFPDREICIEDNKVIGKIAKNQNNNGKYDGKFMSDGEKVALYLIAQILSIPDNKTIIIDEPELHLHRSIMNRLWTAIERERRDCLFVYITHDTYFAASHSSSKKFWIKNFDGSIWEWEEIKESDLPEQLLLDILGNRKNVLFVEGTYDSYDTKLYREVFKNYYVVPCGGCTSVIARTRAMNNTAQLHDLKCFGLIDRDFRSEHEIRCLKKDNIFTLEVAEVENLFLIPEVLEVVNGIYGYNDTLKIEEVKEYIIEERFEKEINKQILESTISEIKYQLSSFVISNKDEESAKEALDDLMNIVNFNTIKQEKERMFRDVLESNDYQKVLRVFNRKSLSKSVGHFFGINDNAYCDFVLRQLNTDKDKEIIDAICHYLPKEILE